MYSVAIQPNDVHGTLAKYMLADGFEMVLDLDKSYGCKLYDATTGEYFIDFFSFFASQALGINHPKLVTPEFKEKLAAASINKVSNSDVYTTFMAEFVDIFGRLAKPEHYKHLFFVEGGSVGNENAIKAAFDWKVQKNFAKGYKEEKGQQVLHFKEAFHGRTGYTLSLTNTDPSKTRHFPKFDWPRITNPKITFPLSLHLNDVIALERNAIDEIHAALKNNKDDIAAIIIEPIQGEGGDNMFRKEFFVELRGIADENEIMLIFDEVQTGLGITGKLWASEHYVLPDMITFGKKTQVCGVMANARVDEIERNCFNTSSRINSTWGGHLTDMVRSAKIIEVMHEENLVENARITGEYLLANLLALQNEFPTLVGNTRGLGLWNSFDFPTPELRNQFTGLCYKNHLAILGCGTHTVRFRPALVLTKEDVDAGLQIIKNVLNLMSK